MSSRRDFPQERSGRSRDDHARSFPREPHRGGQHGGDWSARADWNHDSRERAQYGGGQDRFGGGPARSVDYGNPYESHRPGDWSRQSAWDEDRFGYPESSYGRGGGPQGRFAEDRYSWGREYGGHDQPRQPRHFEPRRSSGWGPMSGGDRGDAGESFAGGRASHGRDGGGMFGGWGIPSGSELGGYDLNGPDRGGPHNWSGSNWGNQDHDSAWGERHSGRFGGSSDAYGGTTRRGRTPKGYTRSDERIRDDVCEQLYRMPDLDVSEVTVEARNGTVILEGTVPHRRMKHRIEDVCEQCLGVQDVENRIRVQRQQDQGDGSRLASTPSPQMDLSISSTSAGGGTSGASDRSNRKSTTGGSSSQH